MADRLIGILAVTALAGGASAAIGQSSEDSESMDARVVALEQRFASLETRFEVLFAQLNGMRSGSDSGAPAAIEIAALQRNIDRLTVDLQRVQRLADAAQREAAQARREAAAAELLARQADTRIR